MAKRRSTTPEQFETRVFNLERCEIRKAPDGGPVTFRGYAAVFNSLSVDLGGFRERIAPGAFASTLTNGADVRLLINHDANLILGRSISGTLKLGEDEVGLWAEAELPDTSYARDLVVSMERGDITQMSFGFKPRKDAWEAQDEETGLPIRELLEADLFDVSPVTYPAYPETSAEVRSIAERRTHELRLEAFRAAEPADLPIASFDVAFDEDEARARVHEFLGADAEIDDVRSVYLHAPADSDDEADFRFLLCDVIDGELRVVPNAIIAAATALADETDEGFEPALVDELRETIAGWYARLNEETDVPEALRDALQVPWAEGDLAASGTADVDAEVTEAFERAAAELEAEELRSGKVLSAKNAERIANAVGKVSEARDDLQALLDEVTAETEERDEPAVTIINNVLEARTVEPRPSMLTFRRVLATDEELREWSYDDDTAVYCVTSMLALASAFMLEEGDDAEESAMRVVMDELAALLISDLADADRSEPESSPRPDFVGYVQRNLFGPAEERSDGWSWSDDSQVYCLTQMIMLGSYFMLVEDSPDAMESILQRVNAILSAELSEAPARAAAISAAAGDEEERAADEKTGDVIADLDIRRRRLRLAELEL